MDSNSLCGTDFSRLDNNAEELGISKLQLMECAGIQATNAIISQYDLEIPSNILIFCGTGNNGGDGFVIARHLISRGYNVFLILFGHQTKLTSLESKHNWGILHNLSCNLRIKTITSPGEWNFSIIKEYLPNIIIDCMLGTGVKGNIKEPIASAIRLFNSYNCPKIAIDVPSGINPDNGDKSESNIEFDMLITFHAMKNGLQNHIKDKIVKILPIGIPLDAFYRIGKGDLLQAIKLRSSNSHKGNYGKLGVIGGSKMFHGAPIFCAKAGLEMGLDLVKIFCPNSVVDVIRQASPSFLVQSGVGDSFSVKDVSAAEKIIKWADSVVIGPGIGKSAETIGFLTELLPSIVNSEKTVVIDADAIKTISDCFIQEKYEGKQNRIIFTPHFGELSSILTEIRSDKIKQPIEAIKYYFERLYSIQSIFVIKGPIDYVIYPHQMNHLVGRFNTTGHNSMCVGGTGDYLAGLIGSFAALGNTPIDSATAGVYLNGKLGELAVEANGFRIQTSDIIEQTRKFFQTL